MSTKLEVVKPFVLNYKTYMPRDVVLSSIFDAHGTMRESMLKSGMIKLFGTPEAEKKPEIITIQSLNSSD